MIICSYHSPVFAPWHSVVAQMEPLPPSLHQRSAHHSPGSGGHMSAHQTQPITPYAGSNSSGSPLYAVSIPAIRYSAPKVIRARALILMRCDVDARSRACARAKWNVGPAVRCHGRLARHPRRHDLPREPSIAAHHHDHRDSLDDWVRGLPRDRGPFRRCSEHDHAGAKRPGAREQGTLDRESPDASAGRGVADNERMTRDATAVKGANAAVTIPRCHAFQESAQAARDAVRPGVIQAPGQTCSERSVQPSVRRIPSIRHRFRGAPCDRPTARPADAPARSW